MYIVLWYKVRQTLQARSVAAKVATACWLTWSCTLLPLSTSQLTNTLIQVAAGIYDVLGRASCLGQKWDRNEKNILAVTKNRIGSAINENIASPLACL